MKKRIVVYILGWLLVFEGFFLMLPCLVGLIYQEVEAVWFAIVALVCLCLGFVITRLKPKDKTMYAREGFVITALSWVLLSLFGALPFVLCNVVPSYIDAVFETASGFTTTGATIFQEVESLPFCINFWRTFTHWIGGMGVLVFIMAVLPLSGGSIMHLMRAESPGPAVGKLVPKIRHTAMILYGIYIVFTLVEIIALLITGMSPFEAMTLTFGTVGTGGFGVLNDSIASYSLASQIVITTFMIICSINFNVYYLLLIRKTKEAFMNQELRYYLGIVFGSALLIAINIKGSFDNFFMAFHTALFQVASVSSTTGFATTDFNLWPEFSKTILVLLMFVGACAGSTGGGIKVSRLVVFLKAIKSEVMSITHPRSVQKVQTDGRPLSNDAVRRVLCYLGAYVIIVLVSILLISLDGKDMTTNLTAVMATFNNIGPGLNLVGPTSNFGDYSVFSKIVLMFDMLVGRLEIFPLLILFAPGLWTVPKRRLAKKKKNFE